MFHLSRWIKDPTYELEPATEVDRRLNLRGPQGKPESTAPAGILCRQALTDRIWLDRDHGLVVRRREMALDGKVMARWENAKLKEIEPGFWLPMAIRHDTFAAKPPEGFEGKPIMTEEIEVQTLEVNHVPDDRFDMSPRKGDQIEDLRGRF